MYTQTWLLIFSKSSHAYIRLQEFFQNRAQYLFIFKNKIGKNNLTTIICGCTAK